MPLPSLTDAQIKSDQPLDEALTKDGLQSRDNWNWFRSTDTPPGADNGGSGIEPNVLSFSDAFGTPGHSHDGTDGQGANIDTAGIADGAASQNSMFADNCVGSSELAANTLVGADFEDMAVTGDKMSGTMGTHHTGSVPYDTTDSNPVDFGPDDLTYVGDRISVNIGGTAVITRQKTTGYGIVDYFIVKQSGGFVTLGFAYDPAVHPPTDLITGWSYDFWSVP